MTAPRWAPESKDRLASGALTKCSRCLARFRVAFHDPVYGACCPLCLAPLPKATKKKYRRASRRVDLPQPVLPDIYLEFDRADPGNPLGSGMPMGGTFRLDGDSHREGWMRILRLDPCAYCGRKPTGPAGHELGRPLPGDVRGTVDHIEPQSRRARGIGGAHSWINYTGACENCNCKKGAKVLLEFLGRRVGMTFSYPSWERREAA